MRLNPILLALAGLLLAASATAQVPAACDVIAVAAGANHAFAVTSDGTLWAWGENGNGQLGDGTTMERHAAVQVSGLTDVMSVAVGGQHALAVKSDGTAWTWGANFYGQLGDGTTTERHVPVQVSGLTGVVALAGGDYHSLALKSDGSVWSWGSNFQGELGDGTTTERQAPVHVSGVTDAIAIEAGTSHSLALKSDGTIWTWGGNGNGQLGDGTTTERSSPMQVSGLSGMSAIEEGGFHSLALKDDGTVWAWGANNSGQLGDGTIADRHAPVQVSGISGVIAIVGGGPHSLALKSDGTLWAWGDNRRGQIGDDTTISRDTPGQVSALSSVTAVAGGVYSSLALRSDGTLWTWGGNDFGQLGDGTTVDRLLPVQAAVGALRILISCPPSVSIECPGDVAPSSTGEPSASGGCGATTWSFSDVTTFPCLGARSITRKFTATDGRASASCTQAISVIDTTPPALDIFPGDATVECSAVPAPATVRATDGCDSSVAAVLSEATTPGPCAHTYLLTRTWTATDSCGNVTSHAQRLTVRDTMPPTVVASSAPVACLWPPNHRMQRILAADLTPTISDNCPGSLTWKLRGCVSDQPDNASGDGNTESDCVVAADGSWVEMRAERAAGEAAGRQYTLLIVAMDECGNASAPMAAFQVVAPHDASPAGRCR